MKRVLVFLSVLPIFAMPVHSDDAFHRRAYETCIAHLEHHIFPSGDGLVVYPHQQGSVQVGDGEVVINFPQGSILNGESNDGIWGYELSAECVAHPGSNVISQIIVNGQPVNHRTISF